MRTTYRKEDVELLLKEVTGQMTALDTVEREKRIQCGVHYSEMLPVEYKPTDAYLRLYQESLTLHAKATAQAAAAVAEKIWYAKNGHVVLVSLARAGLPVGILIKRYLEKRYGAVVPHYGISIIRGRGIDHNAMRYILSRHTADSIQFVDGWVGKGAITRELCEDMQGYPGVSPALAVLADPAGVTQLYGTRQDFLIPSSCLNATVSGLISRTILNSDVIGKDDFHGAVYYEALERDDLSYAFLEAVEQAMPEDAGAVFGLREMLPEQSGLQEAQQIAKAFGVTDINFIKPGIGETTRVLLRRVPWKVLVRDKSETAYVGHILRLCKEKNVPVEEYPLACYRACGIIKNMSADA